MKILLAHNFYQQPGGEDIVFAAEKELLQSRGHTVFEFVRDNNEIHGTGRKMAAAGAALWSRETYRYLIEFIHTTKPDIAHFHNTFPLISPSAYYACRKAGIPMVQTLHNFRLVCPGALLLRDGKICQDCLGLKLPWPGALHACWHNSNAQSAVVTAMLGLHNALGTWQKCVDRYIALSEFSRQKFIEGGLPAEKIVTKPNFISAPTGNKRGNGNYALYVGRLSHEKGLDILLETWRQFPEIPLKIVGDGPLFEYVRSTIAANNLIRIELTGNLKRNDVFEVMQNARFLVIPSKWYEPFPMVAVEAFANSMPVIAANLAGLAEIIDDRHTGLHFEAGNANDLTEKTRWAWDHPAEMAEMGRNARREFEAKYTAEKNYGMLMNIYQHAIAKNRAAQ